MRTTTVGFLAVALLGTINLPAARAQDQPAAAEQPAAEQAAQSKEVAEAIAKFQQRDLGAALKLLQEAAKKDANMRPAALTMAKWCAQANIPSGARAYLEQAVVDEPADPEAYLVMGEASLQEQRITEADLLLQKAAALLEKFDRSPERKRMMQPQLFSGLATVAEARGKWEDAQAQLEAWLKFDPKSTAAMQRLAMCRFRQKDAEGALSYLRQAAKLDPAMLTPEAILARFYQQSGDRENAKKWMQAAVAAAPKDFNTRLAVSQAALQAGELAEAQKDAAVAMQLDPKSVEAMLLRGLIALLQQDYPAAERFFDTAHLKAPDNFEATNNLAMAMIQQADKAKQQRAMTYAEKNFKQYPTSPDAVATYGWVAYKLGKHEEATRAFRSVAQSGAISADTAYYIARLSADNNRIDEAKQWLARSLSSPAPYVMRPEAEALMKRLSK